MDNLKYNKLIAEFMGRILPLNTVHELELNDEDKEDSDPWGLEIRDYKNPFCYTFHKELADPNNAQAVYHPMVLHIKGRYFIYGPNGYHKSVLSKHKEITKAIIPFANAYGLEYDTSWDWIMSVVEKCTSIWNEFEFDSKERITMETEIWNLDNTLSDFLNADIEAIYRRCISFITWYNNKQNING